MITIDEVRKAVSYDPETGIFTRLHCIDGMGRANTRFAGKPTGSTSKTLGYTLIYIGSKQYLAHRLAYLLMTGDWPDGEIDHRDMDRSNNRWDNLRVATHGQNGTNTPARSVSGYKGVYRNGRRWMAMIGYRGERTFLGNFQTPEQASDAYYAAAQLHYGEFARRS